jgi:hypothetical protein
MQRRNFIQSLGFLTTLHPFLDTSHFLTNGLSFNERWQIFIKNNEKGVQHFFERQVTDKNHPAYGGIKDQYELYHPSGPANYMPTLISAYVSPASSFYQSKKIEVGLERAMVFLSKVQHENGNIDLLTTNFNSPPDTAFAVAPFAKAISILQQKMPDKLLDFQEKAAVFLKKAGHAMAVGGVHTPNHRWVICRALARLNSLYPNPIFVNRINQWLGEGIDIDPDGQYNEKSSAGYSPLVNDCLIATARLMNKPYLYDAVRANLDMTLYFVHANGEVVTEASKRQDQYRVDNMRRYYYSYYYMALHDKNPVYAAMANWIEKTAGIDAISSIFTSMLEEKALNATLPQPTALPDNYIKHFPFSKMLRIRRGAIDATILGDNSLFFSFFKNGAALQAIRLASAFFGKGQFVSPSLRIENNKYILEQDLMAPYYQPHKKEDIAPDGDWEKMPRKYRPYSEVQYLKSRIEIQETNGQFSLSFNISGTPRVPLAIELAFRSRGQLKGVEPVPNIENAYFLEKDYGVFELEGQQIEFGPGVKKHAWTQLRGAFPKLNGDCVYLTGFTPFEYILTIK